MNATSWTVAEKSSKPCARRTGERENLKKKAVRTPKKKSAKPLAKPQRTKEATYVKQHGLKKAALIAGPHTPQKVLCPTQNESLSEASSVAKKSRGGALPSSLTERTEARGAMAANGSATTPSAVRRGERQDRVPSAAEKLSKARQGPLKKGTPKTRKASDNFCDPEMACEERHGRRREPARAGAVRERIQSSQEPNRNGTVMKGGECFSKGDPVSQMRKGAHLDLLWEDTNKGEDGNLSMEFRKALKKAVKQRVKHALAYNSSLTGETGIDQPEEVKSGSFMHLDPCGNLDCEQPSTSTLLCGNIPNRAEESGEGLKVLGTSKDLKEAKKASRNIASLAAATGAKKAAIATKATASATKNAAQSLVWSAPVPGPLSIHKANDLEPLAHTNPMQGEHSNPAPKEKSVRPYNRYNIYYILERERLIHSLGGSSGDVSSAAKLNEEESRLVKEKYKDVVLPPMPPRFAGLRLPEGWYIPRNERRTKRPHKKTHGVASFRELAKSIADSWKGIDAETLKWTMEVETMLKLNNTKRLGQERQDSAKKAGHLGKKARVDDDSVKDTTRIGKKIKINKDVDRLAPRMLVESKSLSATEKIVEQASQTQVRAHLPSTDIAEGAARMQPRANPPHTAYPKQTSQTHVATLKISKSSAFSNCSGLAKTDTSRKGRAGNDQRASVSSSVASAMHNAMPRISHGSESPNGIIAKQGAQTHSASLRMARRVASSDCADHAGKSALNDRSSNKHSASLTPCQTNVAHNEESPRTDRAPPSSISSKYESISSAASKYSGNLKYHPRDDRSGQDTAKYQSLSSLASKHAVHFNVDPGMNNSGEEDRKCKVGYDSETAPAFLPTAPVANCATEMARTATTRTSTNRVPWSKEEWELINAAKITAVETPARVPANMEPTLDNAVKDLMRSLHVMKRTQELQERETRELLQWRIISHCSLLSNTARGSGEDHQRQRWSHLHADRPIGSGTGSGGSASDRSYARAVSAHQRMREAERMSLKLEAEQARRILERARAAGGGVGAPAVANRDPMEEI